MIISYPLSLRLGRRRKPLTSLGGVVHILVDGAEVVLLLAAQLPGSENVTDALMEVRVLALGREAEKLRQHRAEGWRNYAGNEVFWRTYVKNDNGGGETTSIKREVQKLCQH